MKRLVVLLLSLGISLGGMAETARESRLEIGPGGVSFSSGGPANGVEVKDGVATFQFSLSRTLNPGQAPQAPITPTAPVRRGGTGFTDSQTFFDGVGRP